MSSYDSHAATGHYERTCTMNAVGPTASTSYELSEYMLKAMGIASLPSDALLQQAHSHTRPVPQTRREPAMTPVVFPRCVEPSAALAVRIRTAQKQIKRNAQA